MTYIVTLSEVEGAHTIEPVRFFDSASLRPGTTGSFEDDIFRSS